MGLLGCTEMMMDQDHISQIFTQFANQLGGIFFVRVLHVPMVIVADPALWQAALAPGTDLPKAPTVYGTIDQMTSPGGRHPNLLGHGSHSGYWRLVRKGVAPAFSPRNIRAEFPHVLELTEQLSEVLYRAGPQLYLDLDNLLQRESLDVIARIGFAQDFGAIKAYRPPQPPPPQPQQPLQPGTAGVAAAVAGSGGGAPPGRQRGSGRGGGDSTSGIGGGGGAIDANIFAVMQGAGAEVVARLSNPLRFLLRHITADARRGERDLRDMQGRMRLLLAGIQARGPPADTDTSIAAHLLRLRDPSTGKPLDDERLAAEIGLFFFAGFETTGHTMSWTLFLLAQHPEAEAKVCAELDALGLLVTPSRPHPRRLEYKDLSRLRYLGMVVKEAMRLVPVSGGTMRVSPDKPLVLGGHTIPAGVEILLAVHGLMNCEHYWHRPSEFLPERWEEPQAEYWLGGSSSKPGAAHGACASGAEGFEMLEDEEALAAGLDATRPPKRFLPFAAGLRNCIGQNLAKMNAHATLAVLLSRFSFQLPAELMGPGALWDLHANRLTMQPKDGLPMRCIPRPGSRSDEGRSA
ncbi:hypothetical protein D9Q98_008274 [Chlorella vulgaris]|uniref:Cytochrome P450 n=1 Tax=Chlorella vulgaris TaxID=3077 RepID=A0A9D4TGE7_CHLVU|nr:hypothetical protein D9Q98_008274 [Chlorella vulgaris]